jgi:peptidoglycan/xylan/chitin deacetylase (PgdA/CDA1 family)
MLSVVNYHYIRASFKEKYPSIFGMTTVQFKNQLLLLRKQGDFISINDLNANYREILSSRDTFYLITFDDGLKEQYANGYAILEELNLEGYFFLNALNFKDKRVSYIHKIHLLRANLKTEKILKLIKEKLSTSFTNYDKIRSKKIYRFDDALSAELKYILNFLPLDRNKEETINNLFDNYFDEKEVIDSLYMSKDEIINLSKKGMIGNHTYSHKQIGRLEQKELLFEINSSKKYLEKLTNSVINSISYPFGSEEVFTNKVIGVSKETNHKFGFTTIKGINNSDDDLLKLKRFDCNDLIGGKNDGG